MNQGLGFRGFGVEGLESSLGFRGFGVEGLESSLGFGGLDYPLNPG